MAALVWESILLNHAFCRGCDFISYSPGTHGMRQKGLKINVRHKKLKKKKRKRFLCFSSWTSLLKARSIMGGERQVGGEGVTPSHSWWWTMRPGWAGSRLPCWGAGDSALCTLHWVSWSLGSGVPENVCICSFLLLVFLVSFLSNASNTNNRVFEICASIRRSCFSFQPKNTFLHLQNAASRVSQLKQWNHHRSK